MSQRFVDSKRNELIANFMEGKEDPEYDIIPSKTTKGKYTVRKRKVSLPVEVVVEASIETKKEKKDESFNKIEQSKETMQLIKQIEAC